MGGLFARWLGLQKPDRVRQIITVCSPIHEPARNFCLPVDPILGMWRNVDLPQLVREIARPVPVPGTYLFSGIDGVVLTKLDVLDGIETLKICTGYRLGDKVLDYLPAGLRDQAAVVPIYEEIAGWTQSTKGARSWRDLPPKAVIYVRRIEELIGAPAVQVTTGPDRDDTIVMRDPFQG